MAYPVDRIGDVMVVELPGEVLDATNTDEVKQNLAPLIEGETKIVFDMSQLQFVDSSGCGMLLSCLRKVNANNGDLKLCGATKAVRVLFEEIRMHRAIDILNTREEAVRSYGA